jgi:hypothetical protein
MRVLLPVIVSAGLVGSAVAAPLEPLVLGWERFFRVDWETRDSGGERHVSGYVHNTSGHEVTRLQLLVEAFDASNQVTSQQVEWLGNTVPPFGRTYFDVPARTRAPQYRVRVFAYDVQQARVESP